MIAFELPHSPTDTINAQIVMFGDDVGCPLVRTDYHLAAEGFGGEGMILNDPKATGKTLVSSSAASVQWSVILLTS